ncbi:MAG TPA: hypothetical protein VM032_05175 [Vicinamibacterales bacterium]|nr:hypothetical protein [Vicinamibacterales bacterium]
MNRLLVFVLAASLGNASVAFAGESLLTSGTRHVRHLTEAGPVSVPTSAPGSASLVLPAGRQVAASFQDQGGTLSKSGMGKGRKTLIYVGLAVAFAASVWTIDHHVLDVTPSSLGTRQD